MLHQFIIWQVYFASSTHNLKRIEHLFCFINSSFLIYFASLIYNLKRIKRLFCFINLQFEKNRKFIFGCLLINLWSVNMKRVANLFNASSKFVGVNWITSNVYHLHCLLYSELIYSCIHYLQAVGLFWMAPLFRGGCAGRCYIHCSFLSLWPLLVQKCTYTNTQIDTRTNTQIQVQSLTGVIFIVQFFCDLCWCKSAHCVLQIMITTTITVIFCATTKLISEHQCTETYLSWKQMHQKCMILLCIYIYATLDAENKRCSMRTLLHHGPCIVKYVVQF